MKYISLHSVAKEFVENHDVGGVDCIGGDVKTIEEKMKTYINNCMSALGVSLSEFNIKKAITKYQITDKLKEHILNVFEKSIQDDGRVTIINKTQLRKNIEYGAFGADTVTEDVVFVTKQFVKENFNDDVYEDLEKKLRAKIEELEEYRQKVYKRVSNTGNLMDGLFVITLNKNIFDILEMEKYFLKVERCYKEYEIGDERKLNEKDMVILDFLGLWEKLKILNKQLDIEALKAVYLND